PTGLPPPRRHKGRSRDRRGVCPGASRGKVSVTVRLGTADDLPHVADLYTEWGYRSAAHPGDTLVVAEHDHRLVGVVRLTVEYGHRMLRGMRVQPAYQRTGVGTQMLQLAAKHIGTRECF